MRRLVLITIFVLTNFYLWGQVWRKYEIYALNTIAVDNQGNKWFSTYNGVYKFDNSEWTKYEITNGLATKSIISILIDKSDNKWFGSFSQDNVDTTFVTKYDGSNWIKYNVVDSAKRDDHSAVWDIKEDSSGKIWFATSSGIAMYDGSNWTNFHIKDGLPSEYVECITFDKQGNKWFGTRNGLVKYNDTTWVTFYSPDTLRGEYANSFSSVAFDRNDVLWAGGTYGLYKLDNSKLVNADSSINTSVDEIAFDRNDGMWLGIYNGFYSKGELRITSANEGINSFAIDTNNDVWLAAYDWAAKYTDTPLIFDVFPEIVELDTIKGSKNYFVINSNTDWTIDDDLFCGLRWLNYNKQKGSDTDTIWITATENYNGLSRSTQLSIKEFGLTTMTVTVKQGRTTSIQNMQNSKIKIYPNPVIDNLVIESASQDNIDKIEIYSINGILLELIEVPKNVMDMSYLKEGIYFLKVYYDSSTELKQIIKINK